MLPPTKYHPSHSCKHASDASQQQEAASKCWGLPRSAGINRRAPPHSATLKKRKAGNAQGDKMTHGRALLQVTQLIIGHANGAHPLRLDVDVGTRMPLKRVWRFYRQGLVNRENSREIIVKYAVAVVKAS